ncbi:hypothetical protein ALI22I_45690 [Saccharothrix sp. ALI-22-I]|uniref:hypothetical protein n=1 Tax=Saccharothrix sp. ALI-22-I TaxID=1933778 RepID=UPI00097BBC37|nr:hypothetical protein [Saccharothrix sp. ALI-22-I]ONI80569.1 hypothetical protein ALI22I_45690 [Saccharothrix sp. ALI-22-I]
MYQTPPQYSPVMPYETPRPPRHRLPLFLLPPVLFGVLFFGGSYLLTPEPDVEMQSGFAAPPSATAVEAGVNPGSPERIGLRQAPGAAPGSVLVRVAADGREVPVGATSFHGARLAAVEVGSRVDRALVGPDGTTAVAVGDLFATARSDGRVIPLDVGETDFFGS